MLVLANEEQKRERDRIAYAEWGQKLTEEGFLERERRLRAHGFAREAMSTWLLLGDDRRILSSCETFRMTSVLPAHAGRRAEGATYGVASVLTEPSLRGRGYAGRMMSLLTERVRKIDPAAHACILFSDVGVDLYGRAGYVRRPAGDLAVASADLEARRGVDLIREHEVDAALAAVPLPEAGFLVWPSAAQIDWHLERERAYASLLGRLRPDACGARTGGALGLWACSFKSDCLMLLLFHAPTPSDAAPLLDAARRAAHTAGLAEVVHWECPSPFSLPHLSASSRRARDGSIPMIKPLDPRVIPTDWTVIPRGIWL